MPGVANFVANINIVTMFIKKIFKESKKKKRSKLMYENGIYICIF